MTQGKHRVAEYYSEEQDNEEEEGDRGNGRRKKLTSAYEAKSVL